MVDQKHSSGMTFNFKELVLLEIALVEKIEKLAFLPEDHPNPAYKTQRDTSKSLIDKIQTARQKDFTFNGEKR